MSNQIISFFLVFRSNNDAWSFHFVLIKLLKIDSFKIIGCGCELFKERRFSFGLTKTAFEDCSRIHSLFDSSILAAGLLKVTAIDISYFCG